LAKKRKFDYRRIWRTIAAVPCGRVASYGEIAELAGHARGARLVARALREAPESLALPWHRIVNARGGISIPASSPARDEQVRRLTAESVPVIGYRIEMSRYRWQPDLDELIWGPPAFDSMDSMASEATR
jgi:methylated-DNA-protein-cysteine methyltransferase-like protein